MDSKDSWFVFGWTPDVPQLLAALRGEAFQEEIDPTLEEAEFFKGDSYTLRAVLGQGDDQGRLRWAKHADGIVFIQPRTTGGTLNWWEQEHPVFDLDVELGNVCMVDASLREAIKGKPLFFVFHHPCTAEEEARIRETLRVRCFFVDLQTSKGIPELDAALRDEMTKKDRHCLIN